MAAAKRPAKKTTAKKAAKKTTAKSAKAGIVRSAGNVVGAGEFRSSPAVRTAYVPGNTFHSKALQYVDIDGMAVVEGDIVLGPIDRVEETSAILAAERRGELESGVIRTGAQYRWTDCKVPYTIDAALPNQARVTDAIAHWEDKTQFSFVLRTAANAAQYPDYVTFRPAGGCSSSVGKQGGQQFVNLAAGCTKGNAIHEIGHTVGLWHEQSREDRDAFVTIHWDKIQAGMEHNFNQQISDGDDVGAYDYGSIMHYPRDAFSTDGSDTITPTDATAVIGQRTALSAGDISAANSMCPGVIVPTIVETLKERFPETRKEFIAETAKERIAETVKERIAETIKERIPETRKELVETMAETLAEGVFGGRVGQLINPNPVINPGAVGGALPFAMLTPHAGFGDVQGDAAAAEDLLAQLAAVNAAIDANAEDAAMLAAQHEQLTAALAQLGWQ